VEVKILREFLPPLPLAVLPVANQVPPAPVVAPKIAVPVQRSKNKLFEAEQFEIGLSK